MFHKEQRLLSCVSLLIREDTFPRGTPAEFLQVLLIRIESHGHGNQSLGKGSLRYHVYLRLILTLKDHDSPLRAQQEPILEHRTLWRQLNKTLSVIVWQKGERWLLGLESTVIANNGK